jgi:PhzF family phenazine biosynthesis protein
MANIAMEMKHAETAFLVPREELNQFDLRWFTPEIEVDLCGHATLASAHALWELGEVSPAEPITFHTRSGALGATKSNGEIQLDFPSLNVEKAPLPGVIPGFEKAVFTGNNKMDWLVQLPSEKEVREFQPDIDAIQSVGLRGLMVTAPGDKEYDFVSRFFAPEAGVPEDSVTGSAHCALGPHWAPRLGKTKMSAYQASPRGGEVRVEVVGGRVILSGKAKTVLVGKLRV